LYYTYIYIYCTFTFAKSHMHPKSLLSRQTKTLPLQLATYVGRIDWWIANSSTVNILLLRKEYPERQTCKVIFLMKPGIAIARLQVQSNYRPLPQSSTGGYQCICHFCTYFSQSVFTGHQSAHKRERICPRWTHSQTFQCWIRRQILCSLMFALELSFNLFSLGILGSFSHVGQIRI